MPDGQLIEFDHVTFEYEPARPVLKEMCLNVKAGQMLGIVGKAGAGKSTMANLMARLYDPTAGTELRKDAVVTLRLWEFDVSVFLPDPAGAPAAEPAPGPLDGLLGRR